ncbi:unnamed protein product [Rotaria sp. Silwood2]|nr:unnamed protein product [Rotaria sp. Silwood2]
MENLTPDDSLIITVTPPDTQYLFSGQYRPPQCHVFNKVYTGLAFKDIHLRFSTLDLLIDKTTTSAYILTFCGDNKDFSILTYHAEPPYEDIAFKIISKECDYRDKHGFRCHFQNGMFKFTVLFSQMEILSTNFILFPLLLFSFMQFF